MPRPAYTARAACQQPARLVYRPCDSHTSLRVSIAWPFSHNKQLEGLVKVWPMVMSAYSFTGTPIKHVGIKRATSTSSSRSVKKEGPAASRRGNVLRGNSRQFANSSTACTLIYTTVFLTFRAYSSGLAWVYVHIMYSAMKWFSCIKMALK